MYNFPEYSDNYWKTWGSLWQYCKDEPPVDNTGAIIDLMQITLLIHLILKKTDQTENDGTKTVEIMLPLKYFINFWRTREMLLINYEINLILTWCANCVIVSIAEANQGATFSLTDTKLYVQVVTLSTKIMQSCFSI